MIRLFAGTSYLLFSFSSTKEKILLVVCFLMLFAFV